MMHNTRLLSADKVIEMIHPYIEILGNTRSIKLFSSYTVEYIPNICKWSSYVQDLMTKSDKLQMQTIFSKMNMNQIYIGAMLDQNISIIFLKPHYSTLTALLTSPFLLWIPNGITFVQTYIQQHINKNNKNNNNNYNDYDYDNIHINETTTNISAILKYLIELRYQRSFYLSFLDKQQQPQQQPQKLESSPISICIRMNNNNNSKHEYKEIQSKENSTSGHGNGNTKKEIIVESLAVHLLCVLWDTCNNKQHRHGQHGLPPVNNNRNSRNEQHACTCAQFQCNECIKTLFQMIKQSDRALMIFFCALTLPRSTVAARVHSLIRAQQSSSSLSPRTHIHRRDGEYRCQYNSTRAHIITIVRSIVNLQTDEKLWSLLKHCITANPWRFLLPMNGFYTETLRRVRPDYLQLLHSFM